MPGNMACLTYRYWFMSWSERLTGYPRVTAIKTECGAVATKISAQTASGTARGNAAPARIGTVS
jgi:hypothetical protein